MRTPYLVFGRDNQDDSVYAAWWPLYVEDGPLLANSPEVAIDLTRKRLDDNGEAETWEAFAAVPVSSWTTSGPVSERRGE